MKQHPLADPKWPLPPISAMSSMMNDRVWRKISENFAGMGDATWTDVVNERAQDLLSPADVAQIDREVVGAYMEREGRKLLASAEVAIIEQPERYMLRSVWDAAQSGKEDLSGLPEGVIGLGDNVFAAEDVEGVVLVLREIAEIERLLEEGVPEGTIGVIDDAGGTMTAPILPEFDAVVCRAGTVRSHLAIIAREFGVPTLMGAVFAREPRTGERLRVRYSVDAQSHEAYLGGDIKPRAHVEEVSS